MIQTKPETFIVSENNPLYFCSDLHFFHKRICDFTERKKHTTIENHSNWLIQQCNNVVPVNTTDENNIVSNSTVLHLGDFMFSCTNEEAVNVLSQLNGDWWFVLGNHDNVGKLETIINTVNQMKGTNHRVLGRYYEFMIVEKAKIRDQKDYKKLVCLCHYPIESWNAMGRGSYHLMGHLHFNKIDHHTGQKMREIPNRLDVGIDAAYGLLDEHKPFTWNEVKSIIRKERLEFEKRYNIKLNEM